MDSKKHELGFEKLIGLFEQTQTAMQHQAARSVDIALVVRNWLFGWYIVAFENGGAERAELYGKEMIDRLSARLKNIGIKGMSPTNLRKFREFYLAYREIQQAPPVESSNLETAQTKIQQALPTESFQLMHQPGNLEEVTARLANRFVLGWTHYVTILTIKNAEERRFYEIEAVENGWGYRELERQINSGLYERLSLSRDKDQVKNLSTHGQRIEQPSDIIKNPYILEFTGLEERKSYSEHDLETIGRSTERLACSAGKITWLHICAVCRNTGFHAFRVQKWRKAMIDTWFKSDLEKVYETHPVVVFIENPGMPNFSAYGQGGIVMCHHPLLRATT